jgi:hypothetical protein
MRNFGADLKSYLQQTLGRIMAIGRSPGVMGSTGKKPLEPIPEERRQSEAELRAAFEAERPRLLGVLLLLFFSSFAGAFSFESRKPVSRRGRGAGLKSWVRGEKRTGAQESFIYSIHPLLRGNTPRYERGAAFRSRRGTRLGSAGS